MTWSRTIPWLIVSVLLVLAAATAGFALGSGVANDKSDAETARDQAYDFTFDQSFERVHAVAMRQGLAAGAKRGRLAGEKTGTREGADLGIGVAGLQLAKDEADAAEGARVAAEAEVADRRAHCGAIPRAPSACPTSAELAAYQAAVAAVRAARAAQAAKPAREGAPDDG